MSKSIIPVGHANFLIRQNFRAVFKHNKNALIKLQASKLWKLVGPTEHILVS